MSDPRDEVARAQREVWQAANGRDVAALERLLDEEFLLVEADRLERKGKRDFLAETAEREEDAKLVAFELVNVRVQLVGDLAVAYAQFHGETDLDGERVALNGNSVDVFVRRGGEWKLLGSVYGEVPPFTE